jgi:predicted aspartyl protease
MTDTNKGNINKILTQKGYVPVQIRQNIAGQTLIDAKINNVSGSYILDTGAGTTVVDDKRIEMLNLKLNHEEVELSGGGLGGHGIQNIPSYGNIVDINGVKIENVTVAVMSLVSAWESLASIGSHDELFGFLGVDILKSGNAILEFNTMTLYLKHG